MKIVFIAGGLYHHISSLTDYLYEHYKDDFCFFATEEHVRTSIKIMGHENMGDSKEYYFHITKKDNYELCKKYCQEADIVIIGCGKCAEYINIRMATGKLTFKLKERLFKTELQSKYEYEINTYIIPNLNKNLYYLTIGTYSPVDLSLIGVSRNKMLKWGYFPYVNEYDIKTFSCTKSLVKLCWAGRYINEKNPNLILKLGSVLKNKKINFHIDMIGYGPFENDLHQLVSYYKINNYVTFYTAIPEYDVRKIMRRNDWFIFTSTFWEGWGVVLNEAMSEGCIPLASIQAGSSLELIRNGKNGFIYSSDEECIEKFLNLVAFPEEKIINLKQQAYLTIKNEWNAKFAGHRLCEIIDNFIETGQIKHFDTGICSQDFEYKKDNTIL